MNGNTVEEYVYDDTGNRIKKTEYIGGKQKTTYYPDSSFIREIDSSGTKDTIYYYDGNTLLARKDSSMTYFYYPDHLGSTNLVVDLAGRIEETSYLPFGAVFEGGKDRFLFTGQEKDQTGLMYYGARYYNPILAHFTQPDTIIQDVYDPQSLNRYSYVKNNPYKYVDPSGHILDTFLDIGFIVWDIYNIVKDPFSKTNWAALGADAIAAAVPFVTGAGLVIKTTSKGIKAADKIKDTIKFVDKAKDAARAIDKGVDAGKALKTTDILKSFKNNDEAVKYFMKDPAFRQTAKEVKNAESVGGTFKVRSKEEAGALMHKVFPDYNPQIGSAQRGTYRIELKDINTNLVPGHNPLTNPHASVDHINIITKEKSKINIIIDNLAK